MERYDAQDQFHAWYEHWHRYHWIAPLLAEKTLVDLACGEGYGSALLAQYAKQVFAIDIDQEAIESASKKYPATNLNYHQADALNTPLEDQAVEAVVSFETLEHLTAHQQLLQEFKRILKPGGLMVLSTPDKAVYSGEQHHNEFHVKELYAEEFESLVEENFAHVMYFGQELQTSSLLAPVEITQAELTSKQVYIEQANEFTSARKLTKPTYLIAVASDDATALQPFKQLGPSYFNDVHNSLYEHYEQQVAQYMTADQQLIEANKMLAALKQQVHQQSLIISQLQARLGL